MTISKSARPIAEKRWVQPKLLPAAAYEQQVVRMYANVLRWRRKLVYSYLGQVVDILDSNGDQERIRFLCQSGKLAKALVFRIGMARPNYTLGEFESHPSPHVEITVSGSSSGTNTYRAYGGVTGGGASADVPSEWAWVKVTAPILEKEGVNVRVRAMDHARLLTLTCYEISDDDEASTEPEGYRLGELGVATGSPILVGQRAIIAQGATDAWRNNGAHLLNWGNDGASIARTSATYANPIGTTTTVTSSTFGWNIETTAHNTVSQAGVPVIFAVYGETTGGATGKARIANSSGMLVEITGIGSLGWYTALGTVPAGTTKVDLQIGSNGTNSFAIRYASLFEYQAEP